MGAFHEGHLQLMMRAREETDIVVTSLFVNPLQFGPLEDFSKYPRNLEQDAELARKVGVNVLFAPTASEMYSGANTTFIHVPDITDVWEGAIRPGHFDGVATVVGKLFHIIRPTVAYFGRKDFQQCAVISRMVSDLNFPLRISIEPTVREHDGLAMSSRNRYLSTSERQIAPVIFKTISISREKILKGLDVVETIEKAKSDLAKSGIEVQYLVYVDDCSLSSLSHLHNDSTIIFAGLLGSTRLIDNISVK